MAGPILFYLQNPDRVCFDCRLYVDAARTWTEGGDPWAVTYQDVYFAAPPPTLLLLAPFTLLPDPLAWQALGAACVGGAVLSVRMSGLPLWWLLFPPVVQGVMSGNVQMLLIPLLLAGAGPLAALLKIYAAVPLVFLRRWRQLVVFGIVLVLTIPILPWGMYLRDLGGINANLAGQTPYGFSAVGSLLLLGPALLAFAVLGASRSAWLAVPALWPSQQWYYASLVLPVRSLIVGAVVAVPIVGSGAIALFVLATYEVLHRRHERRRAPLDERSSEVLSPDVRATP
jgi:hypothetical protein